MVKRNLKNQRKKNLKNKYNKRLEILIMSKRIKLNINKECDHIKIKKHLENWVHIYDKHYPLIPVFSKIRYIDRESGNFYFGDIIISNKSPEKILIHGIGYNRIWRINPKKNTIFIEDHRYRKHIKDEKNKLYQLFCNGKLQFTIKDD